MTPSMRSTVAGLALATGLMIGGGASAAPISYEGTLSNDVASNGSVAVGGGWRTPTNPHSDYWTFWGIAGSIVTMIVERLEFNFDPALWIFAGNFTDTSSFGLNLGPTDPGYLAVGNDNIPHDGPGGDPKIILTLVLPGTQQYTAIVTNEESGADNGDGLFPYRITGNGIVSFIAPPPPPSSSVPEPASLGLLGAGLAGIALGLRRRRQTA
jgi:PEP-CTERM motif